MYLCLCNARQQHPRCSERQNHAACCCWFCNIPKGKDGKDYVSFSSKGLCIVQLQGCMLVGLCGYSVYVLI